MVHGAVEIYEIRRCDVNGWLCSWVCFTKSYLPFVVNFCLTCYSLGDRHGENILFEEGSGGILHVDFNCLFDKVRIIVSE